MDPQVPVPAGLGRGARVPAAGGRGELAERVDGEGSGGAGAPPLPPRARHTEGNASRRPKRWPVLGGRSPLRRLETEGQL